FVDHAAEVLPVLGEALKQLASAEARATTREATGLSAEGEAPRVFVIASIAGGTGSGMLLDLAFGLRQLLEEQGFPATALYGLLLHATPPKPAGRELARINAYATLHELYHLDRRDT